MACVAGQMIDENIQLLCRELRLRGCHTVILYGSRARGDASPGSDYDLAGFGPFEETVRDTRPWVDGLLDVFLYPEGSLDDPSSDLLKLRDGVVLADERNLGATLLARLDDFYKGGPPRLPESEIEARKVWAGKMLERAARGDIEGNFRRVWLLTALLEDYFSLRGLWYQGPKTSFTWLQEHDREAHEAFAEALRPGAASNSLAAVVQVVIEVRAAS